MKSLDSVIFVDNHILVAAKPSNLLTQPDATEADSLEHQAKAWVKREFHKPGAVYLHAIHRLDKPVSGLVLFARTSKALSRLNEQSRNQEIQRIYVAEIEGILEPSEGQLDHYLLHGDHKAIVVKAKNKEAKHARLKFQVLKFLPSTTVVSIELETGRYHQIRAQFSAIGHPVVGDARFGANKGSGKSIHLHCAKMQFIHPVTKELLSLESPTPF
jgi:23S rRNA pseudouridine1911/1915/1917 synthase